MRNKGMRTVAIKDLKENLFVRKQLNQDHVLYLADLIESGVKMNDPIEITPDFQIVEGRHRKEAFDLNGVKEVEVRILEFEDDAEMIAHAYKANTGGSLPPTKQDTEHTIGLLIERGESIKRIGELLGLPASLARTYVSQVRSRIARAKLLRAAAAITEGGLTLAKAAEQHGVELEKLKEFLSGKRRKKNGITEIHRGLTSLYKSVGQKNAALLRSLIEKYEDGDVTELQVEEIFSHVEKAQSGSARSVADWKKRFRSTNGKKKLSA